MRHDAGILYEEDFAPDADGLGYAVARLVAARSAPGAPNADPDTDLDLPRLLPEQGVGGREALDATDRPVGYPRPHRGSNRGGVGRRARPGLLQALAACRPGDTLVVAKLGRLARSVPGARDIADELTSRGARLNLGGSIYDPNGSDRASAVHPDHQNFAKLFLVAISAWRRGAHPGSVRAVSGGTLTLRPEMP